MTTKEKARQALAELAEQAQLREIPFDYDDAEDVVYFTLGTSDEAVTVPLAEGLYVDIDTESEQVVGIELIRFKERFCQQYPELRQAWETVQQAERKVLTRIDRTAIWQVSVEFHKSVVLTAGGEDDGCQRQWALTRLHPDIQVGLPPPRVEGDR